MPDQTLSPTSHTQAVTGAATVKFATRMYDENELTFGSLTANDLPLPEQASVTVFGFPADSEVSERDTVTARIKLNGANWTADTWVVIYFRKVSTDPWTSLATLGTAPLPTPTWFEYDVTALVGASPSTDWQMAVVHSRIINPPDPE